MKVLEITTMFGGGSVGRIATSCCHVLLNNGDKCVIAYGRGIPPKDIETYKIGNKLSIALHVLMVRSFDLCGFGSYFATRKLIKFIKSYNPDVIHLHNLHGYYIHIGVLFNYLKKNNKKIFWTLHDCWSYTGHCPYYSIEKCTKWMTECKNCIKFREHPKSLFFDGSKRNYNLKKKLFTGVPNLTIITPSNWLANELQYSFLNEYPIRVIHNGIDKSIFYPRVATFRAKHNITTERIVILGVANAWGYGKGLDVFQRLVDDLDNLRFQIVMVGFDKKTLRTIDDRIIAIEHTESIDELAEIYTMADIFLNPTRCDNYPTTNLEALSCGTPVITFDGSGSKESVDETCGWTVKLDDYESILKIIKEYRGEKKGIPCITKSKDYDQVDAYYKYFMLYHE